MDAPQLTTVDDMVRYLVDYMGGTGREDSVRDAKKAITQAMRDLTNDHVWSYYYQLGRIVASAPYTTGTIAYDHTGGAHVRMLTLTGGTWPDWSSTGTVRITNVDYEVAERISDTVITLEITTNPGADVASGTSYTIFRDTYPLPPDCLKISEVRAENWLVMDFIHPREWLALRRVLTSAATPRSYTITGDPDHFGGLSVRFYPHPDAQSTYDFIYYRRPRRLFVYNYAIGSLNTTADSAAVAGNSTSWTRDMVGAVLRIADSLRDLPTSFIGDNLFLWERIITGFTSSSSITVDSALDQTKTNRKYVISDPIDVEDGAMLTALQRCCEKNLSQLRIMKDKPNAAKAYEQALHYAKQADSRSFATRVGGGEPRYGRMPLHNYPKGPDLG